MQEIGEFFGTNLDISGIASITNAIVSGVTISTGNAIGANLTGIVTANDTLAVVRQQVLLQQEQSMMSSFMV